MRGSDMAVILIGSFLAVIIEFVYIIGFISIESSIAIMDGFVHIIGFKNMGFISIMDGFVHSRNLV